MWIDSALALSVRSSSPRIKNGTDELTGLHFWLGAERNELWEQAVEIYRRRSGEDISPAEAFEHMVAEVIATLATT